ncbi:hypothetical protein ACMHYO_11450 [Allopusillimonas ginsengisoli]|uniref:hypothetical protein n=1 Tax=Allopusillimonas ginsengisoli TaxID=453575 RepID=UPI0039C30D84
MASEKETHERKEPHIGEDAPNLPSLDPDLERAERGGAKSTAWEALEAKWRSEEKFIRNGQTRLAHADRRKSDADAVFTAGARTAREQAEADFTVGPRSEQARADAYLSRSRAAFTSGPETRKALADADLAFARASLTAGAETRKLEADAVLSLAKARYTEGAESEKTRAEARYADAREVLTRGAETAKTRAEAISQMVTAVRDGIGIVAAIAVVGYLVYWKFFASAANMYSF